MSYLRALVLLLSLSSASVVPGCSGGDGSGDAEGGVDAGVRADASDDSGGEDGAMRDSGARDSSATDSGPMIVPGSTGGPVLLFSDLTVAPSSGWSAADPSRGAVVTVWGRNLGVARGSSSVSVGGVELSADSDYAEAWGEAGKPVPFLQRVSFWLNDSMPDGDGAIRVTVNGEVSNALPFTVGGGSLYFVDASASGSGSGTHADPWASPSDCVSAIAPGDICYFREGVYDQKYNGGKQNIWLRDGEVPATPSAPVAFVGYPGETALFDSRTNGSRNFHTSFRFVSPAITLAKLSIDAYAVGVQAGDDARIIGNDIRGGANFLSGSGIVVVNGNAAVVYGNAIHGGRTENRLDHGIYISGCAPRTGNTLAWNYIFDNSFDRGPMIVVNHQENRCPADVFVRSHFIHHNLVDCSDFPSRAIGIYDLSWDGAPETEPEPTYVYNNIINRCGIAGNAAIYQNAAHARFFHNTIRGSREDGFSVSGGRVLSSRIVNNIIELDNASGDYVATDFAGLDVNHNLYFGAGAYSGSDSAAVEGDPLLTIDIATDTYDLGATSPAIDMGASDVPAFLTTDFRSVARPVGAGLDIGAVERLAD
jgi:hypothetical protein